MKKIGLLSAILTLSVGASAFAASINNFEKSASISFSDVSQSDWFYSTVSEVSAYGIINGVDDSHFEPQGNLTIGQALTLASKVHAIYNNSEIPNTSKGSHWAQGALDYATANGICSGISVNDLNNLASRGTMASLFYNSVAPEEFATTINAGTPPATNNQALKEFYRAGIMTDARENDNVTRAEAAAIILRVIDSSKRMEDKKDTGSPNIGTSVAGDIGSSSAANASEASSTIGTAASTVSAAAFDTNYTNAAGHRNYATIRSAVSSYNGGLNLGNQINVLPSGAKVSCDNYSPIVRSFQENFTSGIIDFISASPHKMAINYGSGMQSSGWDRNSTNSWSNYNDDDSHSSGVQITTRFGHHVYDTKSQEQYDWAVNYFGNMVDEAIKTFDVQKMKNTIAAKYPCSGDPKTTLESRGTYTIEEARDIMLWKAFEKHLTKTVNDMVDKDRPNIPFASEMGDSSSNLYVAYNLRTEKTICQTEANYLMLLYDYLGINTRATSVNSGHIEMYAAVLASNDEWYRAAQIGSLSTEKNMEEQNAPMMQSNYDEYRLSVDYSSTLAYDLQAREDIHTPVAY